MSHLSHSADSLRNGESSSSERSREWERSRERRDSSRSPIRSSSSHKGDERSASSSFEGGNHHPHHYAKQDVKVKEEKREEQLQREERSKEGGSPDRNSKSSEPPPPPPPDDYLARSGLLPGLGPVGLSSAEARLAAAGIPPPPHFWNPLPPPPQSSSSSADQRGSYARGGLELHRGAAEALDREQLMQKYASLSSVMPGLIPTEQQQQRYREAELMARHLSSAEHLSSSVLERERQVAYEAAQRSAKLPPPPLRPNDPPYVPAPGLPPSAGAAGGLFNPFLNSLCTSYPPRTTAKPGSPGGSLGNGIPPPLIPCVSQGGSPVGGAGSTTPSPLHLKLGGTPSSAEGGGRERVPPHASTEIESQSR